VRSKPNIRRYQALANYLHRLFAPKRAPTNTRIGPGELSISAYEGVSVSRCLEQTYLDRPPRGDCAEFYGSDGRLIWEQRAEDDD